MAEAEAEEGGDSIHSVVTSHLLASSDTHIRNPSQAPQYEQGTGQAKAKRCSFGSKEMVTMGALLTTIA